MSSSYRFVALMLLVSHATSAFAQTFPQFRSVHATDTLESDVISIYQMFPSPTLGETEAGAILEDMRSLLRLPAVEGSSVPIGFSDSLALETRLADIEALSGDLSDKPIPTYNHIMAHLLTDYRQHPEHREAIDAVIHAAHDQSWPRWLPIRQRQNSAVLSVMENVLLAFEIAWTFAFGWGVYSAYREIQVARAGVQSLETVAAFQIARAQVGQALRLNRPMILATLGVGTSAGLFETYISAKFDQVPIDAARSLENADIEIVNQITRRLIDRKEAICASPDETVPGLTAELDSLVPLVLEGTIMKRVSPNSAHTIDSYHHTLVTQTLLCMQSRVQIAARSLRRGRPSLLVP